MQNTFGLEIYAANRQFFAGRARSLIIPAEDGQKEFLAHHANMICAIVPGELKFEDSEGNWVTVAVSSGFVEMSNNRITPFVQIRCQHCHQLFVGGNVVCVLGYEQ